MVDTCASFADAAAELALGTLDGQERAVALAHADGCPRCRSLLEGLALTADALVQLAPSAEPPVGFESRLFAAMTPAPRRARRGRLIWASVAAAVLAVGIGFGVGRWTSTGGPTAPLSADIRIGHLMSAGQSRGQVVVTPGKPAWLVMTVSDEGAAATVSCQVTLAGGRVVTVGKFSLDRGYGEWSAPLSVNPSQVRSAQLVGPDGATLASASLSG
jgi:predicted anti-sigma-YlaC factor YlaD